MVTAAYTCTKHGHCCMRRFIREVLGDRAVPCPAVNLTGGFHEFFSAALNQTNNSTTATFDPFANDVNFLLSTFALEETGATGSPCFLPLLAADSVFGFK